MRRDLTDADATPARSRQEGTARSHGDVGRRRAMLRQLSALGVVVPRGTPWRERTGRQRAAMIARGAIQLGLLAAALRDLHRRPADQIRGRKAVWVAVSGVNYLGVAPLVYFAFGRRSSVPPT